jgi:uncharacterized protein YbaP (TraB family)
MQIVMLQVLEARWSGLDAAFAQEITLVSRAREARRPIVALETVVQQRKLLADEQPPAATEAALGRALDRLESGADRRVTDRLAHLWASGDLAALEHPERWCDCDPSTEEGAGLETLNDDRNPALAAGIEALHRDGKRVFAAVGALHMTGPRALPALLAARGFRVERVPLGTAARAQ